MKLARVNTALLGAIIVINGYIIVAPLWPRLVYWWQDRDPKNATSTTQLTKRLETPPTPASPVPHDNRLIIPTMHLDQPVVEGATERSLMQGPWRRPHSSTPDKGGNTVISGHRFTYANPRGTFYFLDKLQQGDLIGIYWQGKRYTYHVAETKVVGPHAVHVEAPTDTAQLTLYTCTPLWSPKDRLVVIARLESHD